MPKSKYVFGDAYYMKALVNKGFWEILGRFADEADPKRRKKVLIRAKRVTKQDLYVIDRFREIEWSKYV
jgi:hypothetical protein